MDNDPLADLERCISTGSPSILEVAGPEVRVPVGMLRRLLVGLPLDLSRQRETTLRRPASIVIDGGEDFRYVISLDDLATDSDIIAESCSSALLSLTNLISVDGGPLPPLVLRRCKIDGVLDLSGSRVSGLRLHRCKLRGLLADGAMIDNELIVDGVQPLTGAAGRQSHDQFCQLRLTGSRITGGVLLRDSVFRSPTILQWREDGRATSEKASSGRLDWPVARGAYANHFAVALDNCEIGGRVYIARDVQIYGGLSLQETTINGSIRISASIVAAHVANEPLNDQDTCEESNVAFNGVDLRVGGSFIWRSPAVSSSPQPQRVVFGRTLLTRARIDSDLTFEDCCFTNPTLRGNINQLSEISGGIDIRRASVGGQLSFLGSCEIGRRSRPTTFRRGIDSLGTALDASKATISLGVMLGQDCTFRGPVHFTAAKVGRAFLAESRIAFDLPEQEPLPAVLIDVDNLPDMPVREKLNNYRPYYTAFKLTDAVIEGFLRLQFSVAVTGRVSLQRLSVIGSAEIRNIPFRDFLPARGTARFAEAPFQGVANGCSHEFDHPPTHDPPTFNETSLLDMQDMSLTGGINWKRYSVSVGPLIGRAIPYNHFIVDLRGMSCSTWDDSDATCWEGLNQPAPFGRTGRLKEFLKPSAWKHESYELGYVPWRLRFDGMKFDRLDDSRQSIGIDPYTTVEPARAKSRRHRLLAAWRAKAHHIAGKELNEQSLIERIMRKVYDWEWITRLHNEQDPGRRSYFTLDGRDEILAFRLQAIESFDRNRWRIRRTFWGRLLHFRTRWFKQSQWKRRELKPAFQPQAFDIFARAYAARGDLETSLGITKRRMTLHWRKRVRLLIRSHRGLSLFNVIVTCIVAIHLVGSMPSTLSGRLIAISLIVATYLGVGPLILLISGMGSLAFQHLFGFGLSSRRALLTGAVFPLIVCTAVPPMIRASTSSACVEPIVKRMSDLEYGLDKLAPGDGGTIKDQLDSLKGQNGCEDDYRLVKWLDSTCDFLGWLIVSLSILTLSGFLKRDTERS